MKLPKSRKRVKPQKNVILWTRYSTLFMTDSFFMVLYCTIRNFLHSSLEVIFSPLFLPVAVANKYLFTVALSLKSDLQWITCLSDVTCKLINQDTIIFTNKVSQCCWLMGKRLIIFHPGGLKQFDLIETIWNWV